MENVTCFMGPTTKAPSLFACRTLKVKQNKNKDNCLICIYYCLLGRWIPVASLGDRDNKGWSDFNHNGLVDPSEIYAPYQYDIFLFLSFFFVLFCLFIIPLPLLSSFNNNPQELCICVPSCRQRLEHLRRRVCNEAFCHRLLWCS